MDPDAIDRVVGKYAGELGLDRGYSAHSMRATFITTALDNGAQLEDVQKAAGHRDPGTTKLYDRRGYNPEKVARFFATYELAAGQGGGSDHDRHDRQIRRWLPVRRGPLYSNWSTERNILVPLPKLS